MKTHLFVPNIILIFSIAILCSITSCKKESQQPEPAPPAVLHFLNEALEYVQLKQGMYLVYKDSASGQEDSVVVKTSLLENKFSPEIFEVGWAYINGQNAFYYDVFTLMLTEAGDTAKTWFFGTADCRETMKSTPYVNIVVSSDSLAMYMQDINYTVSEFRFPIDNINAFYIGDMNVEGTVYTNVMKSFWTNAYNETDPLHKSQTLYWAKGVGIIKWQKANGSDIQTFTLLRHG